MALTSEQKAVLRHRLNALRVPPGLMPATPQAYVNQIIQRQNEILDVLREMKAITALIVADITGDHWPEDV